MTSRLHAQRLEAVLATLRENDARSVLDLGCGDGDLLIRLAREPIIERIVGIDLSLAALARLRTKLRDLPGAVHERVSLVHGSMTEADSTLVNFDAAVLLESIEHLEPSRLSTLERAVFGTMRPGTVVITTPNADFNALLDLRGQRFRHPDHRFEWGRAKFRLWAKGAARRNGYVVRCSDVAGSHPVHGGASQMALFARSG